MKLRGRHIVLTFIRRHQRFPYRGYAREFAWHCSSHVVFASLCGRDLVQDYFMIRTVTISVAVYELAHPLLGKPIDP